MSQWGRWLHRLVRCMAYVGVLVRIQQNFPKPTQRLWRDINLRVINASTKRRCANVAKYELQLSVSAAKQDRCPKPSNAFPLVLDRAIILDDFAEENLAL